jgi:hypothetical protein
MNEQYLKTHGGFRHPDDAEFFMPPPPEIGNLISAETTLQTSTQLMSEKTRRSIVICIYAIPFVVMTVTMTFLMWNGSKNNNIPPAASSLPWWEQPLPWWGMLIPNALLAANFAFLLGFFIVKKLKLKTAKNYCSYIGEKGLANYELIGDRTSLPKEKTLIFENTHSLFHQDFDWYDDDSIRTGASYNYTWVKDSGGIFVILGTYHSKVNKVPLHNDRWHFADKAESLWTKHLVSNFDAQLAKNGYVEFPFLTDKLQSIHNPEAQIKAEFPLPKNGLKSIRVGQNSLELINKKGAAQRFPYSELQKVTLNAGVLKFKHPDSIWSSGKEDFSYNYKGIANEQAFTIYLKKLVGVDV